jgi:hypothetical protein
MPPSDSPEVFDLDSGVWFHTPRLAAAQITQRLQKGVLNQTVL